jgi:hypothetical protein
MMCKKLEGVKKELDTVVKMLHDFQEDIQKDDYAERRRQALERIKKDCAILKLNNLDWIGPELCDNRVKE